MTRSVLFLDSSARWGGGAQASLVALAAALQRRGNRTTIVTTADRGLAARSREAGVAVELLPMAHFHRWNPWRYYGRGPGRLREVMRRTGATLVHTNCEESILPAVRAAGPLGVPVVCHIRDMDRGWFRPHVRAGLARAAAIVVSSEAMRRFAIEHGCPAGRMHVVFNGVDLAPFRAAPDAREAVRVGLALRPGEVAVGLVGQLAPLKGQELLVRAAADPRLRDAPVRWFLVGEDWGARHAHERALKRLVGHLDVADRVAFLGARSDIPALLTAFDVTAAPFVREAFGRVLVESMAAGVPVVGFAVNAVPELVRDGVEGLLVPPGDVRAFAAAVARLVADPALRARLGTAARARAEEFGLDRHADAIERLYAGVEGRWHAPSVAKAP